MEKKYYYLHWESMWYDREPRIFSLTTTNDNSFEEVTKSEAYRDIYYTVKFYVTAEDSVKIKNMITNFEPGMESTGNLLDTFQNIHTIGSRILW